MRKKYNCEGNRKPLLPSKIPREYLEQICYGQLDVEVCEYKGNSDCPCECSLYDTRNISIKKFIMRYGENWQERIYNP